jgi:DNA-binding LacI/PurR family transcriptional regulator
LAAEELNYMPSAAARTLRRGTSDTVLVIIRDAQIGEILAQILEGVVHTLDPHGLNVIYRRQRPGKSALDLCHELMPAAVANFAALTKDEIGRIQEWNIPVLSISFDDTAPTDAGDTVILAQTAIGRTHVAHLHEQGHTRIAYAAPDIRDVEDYDTWRLTGVRDECVTRGLPRPPVIHTPYNLDGGMEAAREILALDPPVTAISAFNDEVATILLAAFHRLNVPIPERLSIIGVDDLPLSPFTYPSLTTINIHAYDIGTHVAQLVLRTVRPDLNLPAPPPVGELTLITRDSVSAPVSPPGHAE